MYNALKVYRISCLLDFCYIDNSHCLTLLNFNLFFFFKCLFVTPLPSFLFTFLPPFPPIFIQQRDLVKQYPAFLSSSYHFHLNLFKFHFSLLGHSKTFSWGISYFSLFFLIFFLFLNLLFLFFFFSIFLTLIFF